MSNSKKVSYYYHEDIGNYYFGDNHPMKPNRIRMTHSLIVNYGLYQKMQVYCPNLLPDDYIKTYHDAEYIEYLKSFTSEKVLELHKNAFNNINKNDINDYNISLDGDNPIFDNMFEYCQIYSGGSVGGAYKLANRTSDICINWAGGMHNAQKNKANGFSYINDIVLAISELLKVYQRVLYVDIDLYHGDAVEEAFYDTDRVMTVSFHKYDGTYFPGTGNIKNYGKDKGEKYSLNVPLNDNLSDDNFIYIFESLMKDVNEKYKPEAIVLQSGANTLSGDRVGCFNLSNKGHGFATKYLKETNIPLLILGGGGSITENVARCWAYETSICLNEKIDDNIPRKDDYYYKYESNDYKLSIPTDDTLTDKNDKKYLDSQLAILRSYLKDLPIAPSVPYNTSIPRNNLDFEEQANIIKEEKMDID